MEDRTVAGGRSPEAGPKAAPGGPKGRRILKYLAVLAAAAVLLAVIVLEFLSRGAAQIFNRAVAQQDMLRGTITVEKIWADFMGHVRFENLLWQDPRGTTILEVPEGAFDVAIWDIIIGDLKATTIRALTLRNALISLHFDKDMQLDFVSGSPEGLRLIDLEDDGWEKISRVGKSEAELKALGERRRQRREERLERGWTNFNRDGRRIALDLTLDKCRVEVFQEERHYLFHPVRLEVALDTDHTAAIRAKTGGFGGMMIGRGMHLYGTVDFRHRPLPECDMTIMLYEVDPSSLGFGMNIHDKMTLTAHFTGPVSRPVGRGTVQMAELNIPALQFTEVVGSLLYEDGNMTFSDVSAQVYGGQLLATGAYNLDTRFYHIQGRGTGLKTSKALPRSGLVCDVDLDIQVDSKGSVQQTSYYGSFRSGKGHYRWLPFEWLGGEFFDVYRELHFSDVNIQLAGFRVSTDALDIVDGKLTLHEIRLLDLEDRVIRSLEPDDWRGVDEEG